MKRVSKVSLLVALSVWLLAGWSDPIHAEVLNFDAHWSGSFSRTGSDIDDDTGDGTGARAIVSDLNQRGSLGHSTVRVVSETTTAPVGFFTSRCPSAPYFVEFTYLAHSSVTRMHATGDLIYTLLDGGHLCLDPGSRRFIFTVDVSVVGGTGRFATATGGGTASGGGVILLLDSDGAPAFGSLDGDTTLDIVVPDGESLSAPREFGYR